MKRYVSPTGMMEENAGGNWVNMADVEAMLADHKQGYEAHVAEADAYWERAEKIVTAYTDENALALSSTFEGFGKLVDGVLALEVYDGSRRDITSISVPVSLMDGPWDASKVADEARKHKAAEKEKQDKANADALSKQQDKERAELARLMAQYPEVVAEATKAKK